MKVRDALWLLLLSLCAGAAVEAYQPTLGEALAVMWAGVGLVLVRRCWMMR